MQTRLFDAYVVNCLKRWGTEFPLADGSNIANGYPSQSTIYVAMRFAGRSPRSNVRPPTTLDAVAWLVELIVSQISTYDARMALVLRAAFCARGSWADRLAIASRPIPASERVLCGSRGVYYRTRDMGIQEVGEYLRIAGDP